MARHGLRMPRLYMDAQIAPDISLALDRAQQNYLVNVLRLRAGDHVLVFNGRDGEWRTHLGDEGKRAMLSVEERTRPQSAPGDLHYLFAPLKHARLDYVVQKAVEMGATRLQPVLTRHGQVSRVNLKRMRANAIEAAQQCGSLSLPEIAAPVALDQLVARFEPTRLLVFCDEHAEVRDPVAALNAMRPAAPGKTIPLAVLVGPEGGFAEEERRALASVGRVVRLSLGPRILRADTAAVAALALVDAVLGDWR